MMVYLGTVMADLSTGRSVMSLSPVGDNQIIIRSESKPERKDDLFHIFVSKG